MPFSNRETTLPLIADRPPVASVSSMSDADTVSTSVSVRPSYDFQELLPSQTYRAEETSYIGQSADQSAVGEGDYPPPYWYCQRASLEQEQMISLTEVRDNLVS